MEDSYGRTIDYMRISITDRCNLRCRYCMPSGIQPVPMKNILSYEEIELICQAAAEVGIRKLKITGGEPLVRLGASELIGKLKRISEIQQVTMTTNGVLLGKYLPQLLENGLDAVNISLDTLNPKTYEAITGKDEFDAVMRGIERCVAAGLKVKVNTVLQKGVNDGEWLEIAELTKEFPVDVRFIEMMPIGHGKHYETIDNESILAGLGKAYPNLCKDVAAHGNGPAVYFQIPGAKGSVGFISAMHGKFCKSCNRLRLTSQGKLKPCLCFGDSVDLREILKAEADCSRTKQKLHEAILLAISKKPREHSFELMQEVTEQRQMVQIGG